MPKKKLVFNKETLVRLQDLQLNSTVGGEINKSAAMGKRRELQESGCRKQCNGEGDNEIPNGE